ncbi:hypothetical protein CBS9595_001581 [Malassezia furfur]|nr:hypothetical protein CBS9595_001581 [Malassezia furfur]
MGALPLGRAAGVGALPRRGEPTVRSLAAWNEEGHARLPNAPVPPLCGMSQDLGRPDESQADVWPPPGPWASTLGNGAGVPGRPRSSHAAVPTPPADLSASASPLAAMSRARHAPTSSLSSIMPGMGRTASPPVPLAAGAAPARPVGTGRARAGTLPSRFSGPPPTPGLGAQAPSDAFGARWRFSGSSPMTSSETFAPMFSSVPELVPTPPSFEPFARLAPGTPSDAAQLDHEANGLAKTLDFLGLDDATPMPTTRERSHTDAALLAARGAYAAAAPGGPVRAPLPSRSSDTRVPVLSATAMQSRMSPLPLGAHDGTPGGAPRAARLTHRPRATSLSTLDHAPAAASPAAATPLGMSTPVTRHASPAASPARAPGHGRHRADTVGALSGPDGRHRTELELHRAAFGADRHAHDVAATMPNRLRSLTMPGNASLAHADRNVYISQLSAEASTRVLLRLFEPYGVIEDIVLFPHHNGALIQFREAQHASDALAAGVACIGPYLVELLADQRVVPQFSRVEAEWAKPRAGPAAPVAAAAPPAATPEAAAPAPRLRHGGTASIVPSSDKGGVPLPLEHVVTLAPEQQRAFGDALHFRSGPDPVVHALETPEARLYHASIPPVHDGGRSSRRFDNARFRELRKNIESGQLGQAQVDAVALDHLDVIVELASNYIGNTVVQRFFEQCSESVKTRLLERLAPHLATIGCHKNGTWAAQKIIDCAHTDAQQTLIVEHLQPYVPALLLDQFGNYVVQCVLPFGFPRATFVLDAMVDRCWEIAQGRFGARSMRTVLEHPAVPRVHIKRVAMAIILNCVPLATSANGALLLTWLLETSNLDGVMGQLAPRFVPHIAQLATHKLASVTVLRIVGRSAEPDAALLLLGAIFDLPQATVLEEILLDLVHGSQLVAKALQSPMLTPDAYAECVDKVAEILCRHDLVNAPAYRRLAEQVGLAPLDAPRVSPPRLAHAKGSASTPDRLLNPMDGIPPPLMPPSFGMMPPAPYEFAANGGMYVPYTAAPPAFDIPPEPHARSLYAHGAPPPLS